MPPLRIPARNISGDQLLRSSTIDGELAQNVVPVKNRVVSAQMNVSAFRTLGAAALLHNVFSIENQAGSTVLVAVRRIAVLLDATTALNAVAPIVKVSRPAALPTGGTVLGKVPADTEQPSNASVVCRGANAADGGAATAITATAGTTLWSQYTMRMHTLVGQVVMDDNAGIPALSADDPIILRPGEALLVQVVAAVATANPATNHWVINSVFEEYQAAV